MRYHYVAVPLYTAQCLYYTQRRSTLPPHRFTRLYHYNTPQCSTLTIPNGTWPSQNFTVQYHHGTTPYSTITLLHCTQPLRCVTIQYLTITRLCTTMTRPYYAEHNYALPLPRCSLHNHCEATLDLTPPLLCRTRHCHHSTMLDQT